MDWVSKTFHLIILFVNYDGSSADFAKLVSKFLYRPAPHVKGLSYPSIAKEKRKLWHDPGAERGIVWLVV